LQQAFPERYPSWADGLLLCAAIAAALAVAWVPPRVLEARLGLPPTQFSAPPSVSELGRMETREAEKQGSDSLTLRVKWVLRGVLQFGTPVLVLLAPGLGLAIHGSRRMFRRRSHRGVGVLTATIAGAMAVFYLVNEYALRRLQPVLRGYGDNPLPGIWREIADQISVSILALWIVLALGRRWHSEPHWRDRLGRALGYAWVGYWFLDGVLSPLWLGW
jgi:hypothetical protein